MENGDKINYTWVFITILLHYSTLYRHLILIYIHEIKRYLSYFDLIRSKLKAKCVTVINNFID